MDSEDQEVIRMQEALAKELYFACLRPFSNHSFNLGLLLKPFGVTLLCESSDTLLVGHVLDAILETTGDRNVIEIYDILDAAAYLGDEDAEYLLDWKN